MAEFVNSVEVSDWEIETDAGWVDIAGVGETIKYNVWEIKTRNNLQLRCADDHILYTTGMYEIRAEECEVGTIIQTIFGEDLIVSIKDTNVSETMYDIMLDDDTNHRYYTNGILSHNSIWLANIALQTAKAGTNVAVITLEVSEKKYLERVASNMLSIPIDDFKQGMPDQSLLKKKIDAYKLNDGLTIPGKLVIKGFPNNSMKVSDLEAYMQKLEEETKIKFDLIVVDYVNLMIDQRNANSDNSYKMVKNICEDLRSLAGRKDYAVCSATQSNREGFNSQSDLTMDKVAESTGLVQTVDALFSINKNVIDSDRSIYRLFPAALRDSDVTDAHEYNYEKKYLRISEQFEDKDENAFLGLGSLDMMN